MVLCIVHVIVAPICGATRTPRFAMLLRLSSRVVGTSENPFTISDSVLLPCRILQFIHMHIRFFGLLFFYTIFSFGRCLISAAITQLPSFPASRRTYSYWCAEGSGKTFCSPNQAVTTQLNHHRLRKSALFFYSCKFIRALPPADC